MELGIKRLVRSSRLKHNTLARDKGRRRLFEHMRDQGEQVETLGNQGRQSDTWHGRKGKLPETRGKLIFQNKTGNDEKIHETKPKCDNYGHISNKWASFHCDLLDYPTLPTSKLVFLLHKNLVPCQTGREERSLILQNHHSSKLKTMAAFPRFDRS